VQQAIEKSRPDAVIHLAGNKNVKFCEANPEIAFAINALGVGNVARSSQSVGAHFVYLSTDLVFDCSRGNYDEASRTEPSSVYGKTKLAGEQFARQEHEAAAICRSGGIYGRHSPLLKWAADELRAGRQLSCLTNVKNTPTFVDNLAEMIEVILQRRLAGTFHTAGATVANRFDFFKAFAEAFELDASLLKPVESETMMKELFLFPNACLDCEKTTSLLGVRGLPLQDGMKALRSGVGRPEAVSS
jgi:dTDP-4-dehydrorhamnose reductase